MSDDPLNDPPPYEDTLPPPPPDDGAPVDETKVAKHTRSQFMTGGPNDRNARPKPRDKDGNIIETPPV